jgi:ADP-L-glycero-D-manno-heptose 6-epimerase
VAFEQQLSQSTGIKFFNVFGLNEYHKDDMHSIICKSYDDVFVKELVKLFKPYDENYGDG